MQKRTWIARNTERQDGEYTVREGALCSEQIQPPLVPFLPFCHVPLVWLVASLLLAGFGCSV